MVYKVLFLGLSIILMQNASAWDRPPVKNDRWPGYVNNEGCLAASNKECGQQELLLHNGEKALMDHAVSNAVSLQELREFWVKYDGHYQDKPNAKYTFDVSFSLTMNWFHPEGSNSSDGIRLVDTNDNPTDYYIKGFSGDTSRFWITYRLCNMTYTADGTRTCQAVGDWKKGPEFSYDDLVNGTTKSVSLGKGQGLSGVKVWSRDGRYRLIYRPSANQTFSDIRTLMLPSIGLKSYYRLYRDDQYIPEGKTCLQQPIRYAGTVKLNNRTCKLVTNVMNNSVRFGSEDGIFIDKNNKGIVESPVPMEFYVNCGAHTNQIIPNGTNVTHSVSWFKIQPTQEVIGSDGMKKVGLVPDSGGGPLTNMYVEGSFDSAPICGFKPISMGDMVTDGVNIPHSFGSNNSKTDLLEKFNTIYWRLCQTGGYVLPGDYTGTATVQLQYK